MKRPSCITPTCGHHHPVQLGELNYTAEQINELLSLIPGKADRAEVFPNDSYLGHYPVGAQLPDMDRFTWAFVGDLENASPYFYYTKSNVPEGYKDGWNDMTKEFGTYLLTPGKQDQLTAEELFKNPFRLPELTADRAVADENGNRITDTYVKREAVANHIKQIYNQQFIENPPLITDGYITPEMLSEDTKNLLENSGQVINNLPDGEDLQSVHGVLKFADKDYNPGAFSGLGRRILRKNIVAGVNVLTQSMMKWPNTIYVIQYDYDLQGAEITIPEGCVLDFQGGSLNDGTIIGKDMIIKSPLTRIFNNLRLGDESTLRSDVNSIWFLDNNGVNDVTDVINNIIKITAKSGVWFILNRGDYKISSTINLYKSTKIKGDSKSQSDNSRAARIIYIGEEWTFDKGNNSKYDIFSFYNYAKNEIANDVIIENIHVEGNKKARYGLNFSHISFSQFSNIFFRDIKHGIIYANSSLSGSFTTYGIYNNFTNVTSWTSKDSDGNTICKYGIRLQSQTNANYFANCRFHSVKTGVSLEDNIIEDGETYSSDVAYHSNQNVFYNVATEGQANDNVIGFYIASEASTFIGCRSELSSYKDKDNSYHIFIDKERGRTNFTNFIAHVAYGINTGSYTDYKQYINIPVPDKSINLIGCNHSFLKSKLYPVNFIEGLRASKIHVNELKLTENEDNRVTQSNSENKSYNEYTFQANALTATDDDGFRITLKPNLNESYAGIQMYGYKDKSNTEKVFHNPIAIPRHKTTNFKINNPLHLKHYVEGDEIPEDWEGYSLIVKDDILYATHHSTIYPICSLGQKINNSLPDTGSFIGQEYYIINENKGFYRPFWWTGKKWLDSNGNKYEHKESGLFNERPADAKAGYAYFCTDRQTVEGATNGIMIYHKGNNVWVDALGRVVE